MLIPESLLAHPINSPRVWLKALAGFGDIAVLLPLATLILLWLVLIRYPRGAAWWAIAVALCAGLTALLKIAFYGCPPIANLHSPSGHTSFSALVYGAMALVFSAEGPSLGRIFTISTAASFVLAIAASRLMLSVHSGPEVGLGLMIGLFSLAVFSHGYLPYHAARQWQFLLVIPGGGLVLALHGRELHFERFLQEIAVYFHLYCV